MDVLSMFFFFYFLFILNKHSVLSYSDKTNSRASRANMVLINAAQNLSSATNNSVSVSEGPKYVNMTKFVLVTLFFKVKINKTPLSTRYHYSRLRIEIHNSSGFTGHAYLVLVRQSARKSERPILIYEDETCSGYHLIT